MSWQRSIHSVDSLSVKTDCKKIVEAFTGRNWDIEFGADSTQRTFDYQRQRFMFLFFSPLCVCPKGVESLLFLGIFIIILPVWLIPSTKRVSELFNSRYPPPLPETKKCKQRQTFHLLDCHSFEDCDSDKRRSSAGRLRMCSTDWKISRNCLPEAFSIKKGLKFLSPEFETNISCEDKSK